MSWADNLAKNLLVAALLEGCLDDAYDSDWDLYVAKYLGIDGLEPW